MASQFQGREVDQYPWLNVGAQAGALTQEQRLRAERLRGPTLEAYKRAQTSHEANEIARSYQLAVRGSREYFEQTYSRYGGDVAAYQAQLSGLESTGRAQEVTSRTRNPYSSAPAGAQQSKLSGVQRLEVGQTQIIAPGQTTTRPDDVQARVARSQQLRARGDTGTGQSRLPGSVQETPRQIGGFQLSRAGARQYETALAAEQRGTLQYQKSLKRAQSEQAMSLFIQKGRQGITNERTDQPGRGGADNRVRSPADVDRALALEPASPRGVLKTTLAIGKGIQRRVGKAIGFSGLPLVERFVAKTPEQKATVQTFRRVGAADPDVREGAFILGTTPVILVGSTLSPTIAGAITIVGSGLSVKTLGEKAVKVVRGERLTNLDVAESGLSLLDVSGEIAPAVRAVRRGKLRVTGEFVPAELVFDVPSLMGETKFPTSRNAAESLREFQAAKGKVVHAGSAEITVLRRDVTVKAGPAGAALKEDPGLFVAPYGRGSPYFLKVDQSPQPTFSLVPDLNVRNPFAAVVQTEGVRAQPASVIRAPDFKAAETFLGSQAGTGQAFITRRSTLRQTSEIEAVLPVGTVLQRVKGQPKYTIVNGQTIPLIEFTTLVTKAPGVTGATTFGAVARQSARSSASASQRRVTPYSTLSFSPQSRSRVPESSPFSGLSPQGAARLRSYLSRPSSPVSPASSAAVSFSRSFAPSKASPQTSLRRSASSRRSSSGTSTSRFSTPPSRSFSTRPGESRGFSAPRVSRPSTPPSRVSSGPSRSSISRGFFDESFSRRDFRRRRDDDLLGKPSRKSPVLNVPTQAGYTPSLYAVFGEIKAPKGKKVKQRGLSGLEVRPII